jgi:alpha-L-fucosidase 2
MTDLKLWFREPAAEWTDALPLGNGRLGAMVHGDPAREVLQLNEDTLWSGGPYAPHNDEALPNLARVRELISAGRYAEAEALAGAHLMAKPLSQMSFQPAGNLIVETGHADATDYRRELDLDTATATTTYRTGNTSYRREAFISPAEGILVLRLTADTNEAIDCTISLESELDGTLREHAEGIAFAGRNSTMHGIKGALRFTIEATVPERLAPHRQWTRQGRARDGGADPARCGDELPPLRRRERRSGRGRCGPSRTRCGAAF